MYLYMCKSTFKQLFFSKPESSELTKNLLLFLSRNFRLSGCFAVGIVHLCASLSLPRRHILCVLSTAVHSDNQCNEIVRFFLVTFV